MEQIFVAIFEDYVLQSQMDERNLNLSYFFCDTLSDWVRASGRVLEQAALVMIFCSFCGAAIADPWIDF